MRETFCFPGYGCPTEIAAVQIKPQWQSMQLEDSLRLNGIYHITAHVRFDFQNMQTFMDAEDLISIDALDVQGDTGYFEYAVPLNVDLPKEAAIEDLMVKDIRPILTNQKCQLEWTVTSTFSESVPVVEQVDALEEKLVEATTHDAVEESAFVAQSVQVKQPTTVEASAAISKSKQSAPAEQKIVLRESSSLTAVRESSSWHEVPTMIWDLTEGYTPLKVRVSNDIFQK
ncbi:MULTISPECIES: valyl-tRNA synthetase [unclassified Lysinibacillus]|uniref:valyl-tRNA synthetase n=1 Tax=unclassified Lysinibacillus TaxID=2636778 RepID=UPI0030F7B0D3